MEGKKYCKHCGSLIDSDCVVCTKCGKQVEELKSEERNVIINNSSSASAAASASASMNMDGRYGVPKDKIIALLLCIFLGMFGAHKFYEGKIMMGILYICTFGLFGIGWIVDIIKLLGKPNPYYV